MPSQVVYDYFTFFVCVCIYVFVIQMYVLVVFGLSDNDPILLLRYDIRMVLYCTHD